jgi:hypothetical protein
MGVLVPRLHYTFFQAGTWSLEEEGNQKKEGACSFFFFGLVFLWDGHGLRHGQTSMSMCKKGLVRKSEILILPFSTIPLCSLTW